MLYGEIGLAVGAPTEDELERRVAALREEYGDLTLHRPVGLQYQLWLSTSHARTGGCDARLYPTAHRRAVRGNGPDSEPNRRLATGPYLDYKPVWEPLPVRFDPKQAPREDRASAVLLIGTLGSGKTVASQLIEHAAERRGSLVVDFDAKPDHGWENLPELTDRLQLLERSGAEVQQGRLDSTYIGLLGHPRGAGLQLPTGAASR